MIHIAIVHWNTGKWIDIQLTYLRKHIRSPYRVYAWLNDVPSAPLDAFYYTCSEPVVSHAVKLNILADIIYFSSNREDDILIFLDGDAFPIGDIEPLIEKKLSDYRLIAVQRLENSGDIQPHPCFCATTVGFWKSIRGDWKGGYKWRNNEGRWITDVGGNLLKQLRHSGVEFYPLLRSNKRNLHPLLFGIYEDVIYHHGAGFRDPLTRIDQAQFKGRFINNLASRIPSRYGDRLRRILFSGLIAERNLLVERVFKKIQEDPNFYHDLI